MNAPKNIKLYIEFDGSEYSGWMRQGNDKIKTIQETVEEAILRLTGENAQVMGCSRTDAGVHAVNYVANFITSSSVPSECFYKALNQHLPADIKAKHSECVPLTFNAAYSALKKTYRYYFYFAETENPLFLNRAWLAAKKLNISSDEAVGLMNEACKYIVGHHDFSSFKAVGGLAKTSERTVYSVEVAKVEEKIFRLEICGDGFLYNMVRIIAGTLAGVALGRFAPSELADIIEARDRKKAGMTAPPHGLYLYNVEY